MAALAEAQLGDGVRKSRKIRRLCKRVVASREAGKPDVAAEENLVEAVRDWGLRKFFAE